MALETPELSFRISAQIVQESLNWNAHTDIVGSLSICKKPKCLVTAGHDHMVKIWTRDGDLMTALGAQGQPAWHFPVQPDEIPIDETLIDDLRAVMRRQFFDEEKQQKSSKQRDSYSSFNVKIQMQSGNELRI